MKNLTNYIKIYKKFYEKKIYNFINILETNFLASHVILILSIFFISFFIFQIDKINFSKPLLYGGGDGILIPWFIKNIIKFDTIYKSPLSSAPSDFSMYQWPMLGENIHFFFFKVISIFTNDIYQIYSVYYLIKFYITGLLTFYSLKKAHISNTTNIVFSILFAFSPIAFQRYLGHYFLGIYYTVPAFFVLIIYSINIFYKNLTLKHSDIFLLFFLIIFISLSGFYYLYFSLIFLFILFLTFLFHKNLILKKRKIFELFLPLIFIFLIIFSLSLGSIDIIKHLLIYENSVRDNPSITSDIYGLKIVSLFLPISNHLLSDFSELKNLWSNFPLTNENLLNSIGIISSLGLIFLFLWPIFILQSFKKNNTFIINIINSKKITDTNYHLLNAIYIFVIYGFLIASIGGFSLFIIEYIFPGVRAYSRISIFFNFFGIFVAALFVDHIKKTLFKKKKFFSGYTVLFVVIFLGLSDQIGKKGPLQILGNHFESDKKFFNDLEISLEKNSKVFLLPVVPFPEHSSIFKMIDYDHIRSHIHTNDLHFSYPAMKKSNTFKWQSFVTNTPLIFVGKNEDIPIIDLNKWKNYQNNLDLDKLIFNLKYFGFNSLVIDTYGFKNDGIELINSLKKIIKVEPHISDDKRYISFFIEKHPFVLEIDKKNYPKKLIILDKYKINNSKFPTFLDKNKILKKLENNSDIQEIDIYLDSKSYFDRIFN
jgi:hypothetical protein